MNRLRTSLVVLALGGATVTAGVVATTAFATPAPVLAVEQTAPVGLTTAADDDPTANPQRAARGWWRNLTDAQQACLEKEVGNRPVGPLTDAEREALRAKVTAAAATCDVELPFARALAFWNGLTDEQQQCLEAANVERPWGPLTKQERQKVRQDLTAAARTCGVTLPTKASQRS